MNKIWDPPICSGMRFRRSSNSHSLANNYAILSFIIYFMIFPFFKHLFIYLYIYVNQKKKNLFILVLDKITMTVISAVCFYLTCISDFLSWKSYNWLLFMFSQNLEIISKNEDEVLIYYLLFSQNPSLVMFFSF